MDQENTPERNKLREILDTRAARVVGGVAIAAALTLFSWKIFDRSGDVEVIKPKQNIPKEVDQYHSQLSWNMHNETAKRWRQIGNLIETHQVDVAMLQEVNQQDFQKTSRRLPDKYTTFVLADKKSDMTNGGYGNLLITSQKPRDIKSESLSGSGFFGGITQTFSAMAGDLAYANTDVENTKDAWQADRSVVAATISVQQGEEVKDVRVITGHIAGNEKVHEKQLGSLIKFVKNEVKENRPTIFCGDLNDTPENIIPRFASIGFITPETGGTWTGESHNTIDYCSYNPGTVLGLGKVSVLNQPHTDHYPVVGTWTARLPEEG